MSEDDIVPAGEGYSAVYVDQDGETEWVPLLGFRELDGLNFTPVVADVDGKVWGVENYETRHTAYWGVANDESQYPTAEDVTSLIHQIDSRDMREDAGQLLRTFRSIE